jgi:hypothetical protein
LAAVVRTVWLGVVAVVVAVLLTLYASGPSIKPSSKVCRLGPNAVADALLAAGSVCVVHGNRAYFAKRTNAWERFKGAITGTP